MNVSLRGAERLKTQRRLKNLKKRKNYDSRNKGNFIHPIGEK